MQVDAMVEKIIFSLLGALMTGVGILIMRALRKEHVTEELARRKSAGDLIAHFRDIGVSQQDADAVLASIGRKRGDAVDQPIERPLTIEEQIEAKEFAAIEAAQSQREMNGLQAERAERLNRRMEDALLKLRPLLPKNEAQKLSEAQSAWLKYRTKECALAGAPWEGGSMQPFMVAGMSSRLTKQRAEILEAELASFDL